MKLCIVSIKINQNEYLEHWLPQVLPKTWKKWGLYLSPSGALNSVMRDSDGANNVSNES